jgi:hypothetical protein
MAYQSLSGLRLLYYRTGGAWVLLATASGKLYVRDGSAWFEAGEMHWLQSANRSTDTMNYQQFIRTDKYAPTLAPTSFTLTSLHGALLRRNLKVDWGDPSGYAAYDVQLVWTNETKSNAGDPSFNGNVIIPTGRSSNTYTFIYAGDDGDSGHVDMYYVEHTTPAFAGGGTVGNSITLT